MEVPWFGDMEEVVCNGDDLILNLLFNFEPMEGIEYWGDVRMLGIRVTARASPFSIC